MPASTAPALTPDPLPAAARGRGALVRLHWRLARGGFRRESTYRLAMLGGLAANLTFGLIRAAVLSAAFAASPGGLGGYDLVGLMTYVWLGQGLLGALTMYGRNEIGSRIASGEIVTDFLRPAPILTMQLATDVGRAVYTLVPRGLPSILVGALVSGIALTRDPVGLALAVPSLLLGIAVSYLTAYCLGCLGFWVVDVRGLQGVFMVVSSLFTGLILPLAMFPAWLAAVARLTPFPATLQAPVDILSGRVTGIGAAHTVGVQALWLVVTAVVAQALLVAGRRRWEANGG